MNDSLFYRVRRISIHLLPLLLVAGCVGGGPEGSSGSSDLTASPLAPYLAPASSDTPAPAPVIPTGSYPTTTANGYYTVLQSRTLAMDYGVTTLGFAVDPVKLLMLEQVALTGGISRWRVLYTPLQPGTGIVVWTLQCDLLSDGTVRDGFAADSTYYYLPGAIPSDPYHEQYLRRIRRADCSEAPPLDTGHGFVVDDRNPFAFSVYSGRLYFEQNLSGGPELNAWDLVQGTLTSQALRVQLGGKNPHL